MTRELLILRHGKSDWKTGAADFDRPLTDRGKRGAKSVGIWLRQQDLIPAYVVTSPAKRALITAKKTCKAMGYGTRGRLLKDKRIYLAGLGTLREVLKDIPKSEKRVMLVGHNPGLEELLVDLADCDLDIPADGKLLPTATLAHLEIQSNWKKLKSACGRVRGIVRASTLL